MTIEKEFKEVKQYEPNCPEYFQTGDVPLKDVVVASNAIFKKMASEQVQYEEEQAVPSPDSTQTQDGVVESLPGYSENSWHQPGATHYTQEFR